MWRVSAGEILAVMECVCWLAVVLFCSSMRYLAKLFAYLELADGRFGAEYIESESWAFL